MKRQLSILSIILALAINYALAQKNTSRNVIIFANGDTLFSPQISGNQILTNQDGIAYTDKQNTKHKLTACQIREYYLNNEYFHSVMIKNENICRLITYEVGGYISFGLSYTANGDMNYYVKKDDEVTSLEKDKYELKAFFSGYLPDFDQFYATYKVKISYDFKTLAEMISAYNAYKFPEKYVFQRVKNKEKGRIGIIASGGLMNTKLSGFYADKLTGGSFSFGMDIESRYSRYLAIHIPLTYNIASGKGSNVSSHWSTVNFEPYLTFTPIPKKKINFEFGAGVGMLYSMNSYLDCSALTESDQNKVYFNKMNFGPNLSFIVKLSRNLKTQLMFTQYKAKTTNLKMSSIDDTSVKASTNNFRLMISYYF
jgi:hypothetical protein